MSATPGLEVLDVIATDAMAMHETRALVDEYARDLGVDLSFQGFDDEMGRFPAGYQAPDGALLLARLHRDPVGCVALRRLERRTCEMKRLYVRPYGRGSGVGRTLVDAAFERASRLGFRTMRLDTIPSMYAAQAMYRALGFREIPSYYRSPIAGTIYMEADVARGR